MNGTGVRERLLATGNWLVRAGLAGSALLVTVAIAAGCDVSPPNPPQRAPLSFAGHPPLVFDLGRIEVVESPAVPDPSDVDHLLPTPPAVAVRLWVEDRLRASGSAGLLRVTVEEASARITPLATNTDFEGLLTREQSEQFDARLRVTIEALDGSGTVRGSATVDTARSPHAAGGHHPGRARADLRRHHRSPAQRLQRQPGAGDPTVSAHLSALRGAAGAAPSPKGRPSPPSLPPPPSRTAPSVAGRARMRPIPQAAAAATPFRHMRQTICYVDSLGTNG